MRDRPADLPVAAPDPARLEALREEAKRGGLYQAEDGPVVRVPSWEEVTFLLDLVAGLLAERQQDKERIERLSEGLILAADALEPLGEWLVNDSPAMPGEVAQPLLAWIERAEEFMAALAVEEEEK